MTTALSADDTVLESKRLHLGRAGQFEWESFKDVKVDAERFERRFEAVMNASEQTLRIWQHDVKLSWPVLLNGRKLGTLVNAETAMESLLAIPPGAFRDGENVLTIEPPSGLDDVEVGPVIITAKPMQELLSGAQMEVTVTDLATGDGLPCRLTVTRPDGTLQPLRAEPLADVAVRVGVVYTRNGRATISLPLGEYVLHAGRGFEWSVERAELVVKAGETKPVALQLKREVDTSGWIAADSHIHTLTHSGHGDAKIEERMLTIAGRGSNWQWPRITIITPITRRAQRAWAWRSASRQ